MAAPEGQVHDRYLAGEPKPGVNPLVLRILTLAFLATLFFTTAGIWLIDRYLLRLDDLRWSILILVPWVLFILLLTTVLVFQVIRGVLLPWQSIRR
jgi:hypothetical protein